MFVKLLEHTRNPLSIIQQSAEITHGKIGNKQDIGREYLKKIYSLGHTSIFEHISFTFLINGISRACSHQLVRFRVGVAFTQKSQRYTSEENADFIIPQSINEKPLACNIYHQAISSALHNYQSLIHMGIPKEDARFVLPNATSTSIIMTMNLRELIHACGLRLCAKAQWEIRELFQGIKEEVASIEPEISHYLVPQCIHNGICKEQSPCKDKNTISREHTLLIS